jgi:hypothetical protein
VPTNLHSEIARRYCTESACCKRMFQVFQMFQRYVASVSCGCCKSILGCCTCCNSCISILQASVLSVSSFFLGACCKCVYLDVKNGSHICYKCFTWMFRMFYNGFQVFSCVFQI